MAAEDTNRSAMMRLATAAAERAGIDPALFLAMIEQESGFRNHPLRSQQWNGRTIHVGGIAQIVPEYHSVDVMDPEAALNYAADLLRRHLESNGGDEEMALVQYNGGRGAVDAWKQGQPYRESRQYVERITQKRPQFTSLSNVTPTGLPRTGTGGAEAPPASPAPAPELGPISGDDDGDWTEADAKVWLAGRAAQYGYRNPDAVAIRILGAGLLPSQKSAGMAKAEAELQRFAGASGDADFERDASVPLPGSGNAVSSFGPGDPRRDLPPGQVPAAGGGTRTVTPPVVRRDPAAAVPAAERPGMESTRSIAPPASIRPLRDAYAQGLTPSEVEKYFPWEDKSLGGPKQAAYNLLDATGINPRSGNPFVPALMENAEDMYGGARISSLLSGRGIADAPGRSETELISQAMGRGDIATHTPEGIGALVKDLNMVAAADRAGSELPEGRQILGSEMRDPDKALAAMLGLSSPFMGRQSGSSFAEALRRRLMQYRQQGLESEQTPFEYLSRALGYQ